MAGAGLAPRAIVLALGAGALGGPEALRLLLQFADRSAASDLAICVVTICVVTTPFLGTILLARFVRKVRAAGGAPATDLFAQVTATVSVGAAVLVTACLLLVGPGPGAGLAAVRFPVDFAVRNPVVVTTVLVVVCAAAVPPIRFFRGAGRAGGGGPGPAPAAPATAIQFLAPLLGQTHARALAIVGLTLTCLLVATRTWN